MNKPKFFLLVICGYANSVFSQSNSDSIIRIADLRYHSDFEKNAINNFIKYGKDTFNLFLAIDDKMSLNESSSHYGMYKKVFDELRQKNIESKKNTSKIKLSYSTIHSRFLKKYNDNEYFPVMFQTGTYNCVSASMLYALAFDELKIPYKVMVSSNHVYLIANPGSNSIVIETTNPGFEKAIFTGEFKQQYVNYLRSSKLISEEDYKNKSIEEIFEEKFNAVKVADFWNLPGFQYYNKALAELQMNDIEESLTLCQKAYFFFPDQRVKALLNNVLLLKIEKCAFNKVSDIDYLAQFSRFESTDLNAVVGIFNNIIAHFLQFTDKDSYCDSMYQRLISQISDKNVKEEISFAYNMQMSYRYINSEKVEKYIVKALEIKSNHHDANIIMESFLNRKLYGISNPNALLDTINQVEMKYNFKEIAPIIKDHKLMAYLKIASDQYVQKKISEGDRYLQEFEKNCSSPIKNQMLEYQIENTYLTIAAFYFNKGNNSKSKSYVDRGLKYLPNSIRLSECGMN